MEEKDLGILDIIKKRRSIREFEQRPVSREFLTSILDAGRWAPSGMNNQPWRFVVVEDEKAKFSLAEMTKYSSIILLAPLVVAVFLDKDASYSVQKDILAIGACIQNMLLQIHALGLGGCWLGEILNRASDAEALLGVPSSYELLAVIAVGYPKAGGKDTKGTRRGLKDLVLGSWPVD